MENLHLPVVLNAVYDETSGEILIAHPTKENVFVQPSHYNEIKSALTKSATNNKALSNAKDVEKNCVYTQREVCINGRWAAVGVWLCDRIYVQTCNCR